MQQCVKHVKEEITELQQVHMAAFGTRNEQTRAIYMHAILQKVLQTLQNLVSMESTCLGVSSTC